MSILGFAVAGLVVAFFTAATATALTRYLSRSQAGSSLGRGGAAVGLGLGYVLGHATVREWFSGTRPKDAWDAVRIWTSEGGTFPLFAGDAFDWLPWLATAAAFVGALDAIRPAPGWARWENRAILTALTLWLILGPLFGGTWEPGQGARWLSAIGAGILLLWAFLDGRAEQLKGAMAPVLLASSIALAIVLGLSGSAIFAFLGGVLSAAIAGVWVASWWGTGINLSRGVIPPFVVVHVGLILSGLFYAEVPRISALALSVAPVATSIDRIGRLSRLDGRKLAVLRAAALLIPLLVAIGLAALYGPTPTSGEGE